MVPVVSLLPQADYHCAICVMFVPWVCCRSVFSGLQTVVWHFVFNAKDRGSIFVSNAATSHTCTIERCAARKLVVQHFPSVRTPSLLCGGNCSWDVNHSATLGVVGAPDICKLVWFRFVLVDLNGRFSYETMFFILDSEFSSTNFLWVFYDAVVIRDYIVDGRMMLTDEPESIWNGASVTWSEALSMAGWCWLMNWKVSGRERLWREVRHSFRLLEVTKETSEDPQSL